MQFERVDKVDTSNQNFACGAKSEVHAPEFGDFYLRGFAPQTPHKNSNEQVFRQSETAQLKAVQFDLEI